MTTSTTPDKKPNNLPAIIALIVIVGIIGVGLWLVSQPKPSQLQGMIDTDEIRVATKSSGRIETLVVKEGDYVKAGQLLFTLSSKELEAKLAEVKAIEVAAQAQHAKAETGARTEDIESARSAWLSAQAEADVATTTLNRVEALFTEGVVSAQKRDEVAAKAKASAAAAHAVKTQYEKAIAGTRVEDKAASEAQVKQAAAAVAAVAAMQAELKGYAPIDGQVTKRFANLGEIIIPGYPVFAIIDPKDIWVSLNVRESDFSGIHDGKIIRGSIPALAIKDAHFKIYFINAQGDYATWRATRESDGYDIKSFEVRAQPIEPIENLRPGMSVLFDWPQKD